MTRALLRLGLVGVLVGSGACGPPPSAPESRGAISRRTEAREPAAPPALEPNEKAAQSAVKREPPRPRAEEVLSPALAPTPAAAALVALITEVDENLVETRYRHDTEVRPRSGYYAWDCSGMVAWMLRRSAPRALRSIPKSRPRAIDFYRAIIRAPTAEARRGWRRLAHVSEARPGDLFAFPRSPISKSRITGHVGVFVERPWPVAGLDDAWAARILDATRIPHQDDTRSANPEGGFGFGTMMFVNDESGKTIAYGWHGTDSRGYLPTHVVYGRVTR